jgi:hypothetical protein
MYNLQSLGELFFKGVVGIIKEEGTEAGFKGAAVRGVFDMAGEMIMDSGAEVQWAVFELGCQMRDGSDFPAVSSCMGVNRGVGRE